MNNHCKNLRDYVGMLLAVHYNRNLTKRHSDVNPFALGFKRVAVLGVSLTNRVSEIDHEQSRQESP